MQEENTKEITGICKIVTEKLQGWSKLSIEDITFEKMGFGLSRATYKLTVRVDSIIKLTDDCPSVVIFKVLKQKNPNALIDIDDENSLFSQTSALGIGPKVFSFQHDNRIEECLDAQIIQCEEINQPDYRRKLAIKLGLFHTLDLKIDKSSFLEQCLNDKHFISNFEEHCKMKDAYTEDQNKIIEQIEKLTKKDNMDFIAQAISPKKYKYVLSHNDIWMGNILVSAKTREVFLIDYERVAYNFSGYDIAKLLLEPLYKRIFLNSPEYVFVEKNLPSEDDIKDFLKFYVFGKTDKLTLEEKKNILGNVFCETTDFEKKIFESEKQKEEFLKSLLEETYIGMMVCGYFMSILGLYVGNTKQYGLDFLQFGLDGFYIYEKFKKQIFK